MKISMYILEKWLEKENPQSDIREGTCAIKGLRLFEEGGNLKSDYLYVGHVENPGVQKNSYHILLMHRNDSIRLKNDDLNYVVNRILEAFEFFETLEQRFFQAYYHSQPEQEIISAVEHMLGPCFIMQPDYKILACSQNFDPEKVNVFWNSFMKEKSPTLQNIEKMKHSAVMNVFRSNPSMVVYTEPAAEPYKYAVANTYKRSDGSVIGYLVVASNRPITEYEKDMARILITALNHMQQINTKDLDIKDLDAEGEILFSEILGNPQSQRARDILSVVYELNQDTVFQIISIHSEDKNTMKILQEKLKWVFPHVLITMMENTMVALIWKHINSSVADAEENENSLRERLVSLLDNTSLVAGISNPFIGLENSYLAMDQAEFLFRNDSGENVRLFSKSAVAYLLSEAPLEKKMPARHPAIVFLEKYDWENKTELLSTLKKYLYYERSVRKTAENMFIHKNTVLYRIHQIRELCGIDLEDDSQREYIVLSLMLS